MFAMNFRHFLFVFRNPDGAALLVLDGCREIGLQLLPKLLRVSREGELSRRIVHDDDVSHGSAGCARSDRIFFKHNHTQPLASQRVGASAADDAGANDRDVASGTGHARMPMQRGSSGSRMRVESEFTKARPVMLGKMSPSRTSMRPSKILPVMLSWRQTSPGLSFPSA